MPEAEKKESKSLIPGEEIDKAAADLLRAALGKPADESAGLLGDLIGIVGDNVRSFRALNRIRILTRAKEVLEGAGISLEEARALPLREVDAVLQGAANVDEPELQEMWAGLLANAMDPSNDAQAERHYTALLEQMTGRDAVLLRFSSWVAARLEEEQKFGEQLAHEAAAARERRAITGVELSSIQKASRNKLRARAQALRSEVSQRAELEGLVDKFEVGRSLRNLARLGLIVERRRPFDFQGPLLRAAARGTELAVTENAFTQLGETLSRAFRDLHHKEPSLPLMTYSEERFTYNYRVSAAAKDLLAACGCGENGTFEGATRKKPGASG